MTMYNNYSQQEGGELSDSMVFTAEQLGDYDKSYTLLPEGEYRFTVVKLTTKRYEPTPNSKIGPCKQIVVTVRVAGNDGETVDLDHNLYMWNSKGCLGMITQFYDAIGLHRKGEPLRFDWRESTLIGANGTLQIKHRIHRDDVNKPIEEQRRYNDIRKFLPAQTAQPAYKPGQW